MYLYRRLSQEERAELVRARLEQGHPPHQPPHPQRDEALYLFTASCYEHCSHMQAPERRTQVLDLMFEHTIERSIELLAWVVLPNHYHLLARVPEFATAGEALRRVHGPTARAWNAEDGTPGRRVWYRYTDRAIRSEPHTYTTLNYIHFNPVKHGVAPSPYDWIWSSVHWYLDTFGRDYLRDCWRMYPLHDYGKGWDDL